MRLSFWVGLQQPWDDVVAGVRHAEATGWDGIYVADHFMGDGGGWGSVTDPNLEATATLAALAACTERVRLGTLVLSMTYRHPAVLANWAASLDQVSGGRLTLGVGAGWQENEHRQYGLALGSPGERLARFDEGCQVLRGMLADPTTTVEGRHFSVRDAVCEPKPVQTPLPLLVGGKGDRMLGLVARHADIWNQWGLPETMAERGAVLDRRCEAIGRDPASIGRSAQALVFLTDDEAKGREMARTMPRAAVGGPAAVFGETVAAWAAAGVDEVIVPDFTLGRGSRRADALDALLAAGRSAA